MFFGQFGDQIRDVHASNRSHKRLTYRNKSQNPFFTEIQSRLETPAMVFETEPIVTRPPIEPHQKLNMAYKT